MFYIRGINPQKEGSNLIHLTFNNIFLSPIALLRSALNDLEAFQELHLKLSSDVEGLPRQVAGMAWSPPSDSIYKLNFDAAYHPEKKLIGIGIVIRNCRGEAMIIVSASRSYVCSAFSAECYTLLISLQRCQEMGLQQVVLEGDANCSWQGQLIDDIKHLLFAHVGWKLNFFKRNGNKAAHSAAKLGMLLEAESVCIEDGPPEVMSVILLEKPCTE